MESKQSATLCSLCLSFSMLLILPRFILPAHTMRRPSTYSPRLLITETNRIRLRTSPLKSPFFKGTSVNILRIFCSPLATNTTHLIISSFGPQVSILSTKPYGISCHMSWGRSSLLCLVLVALLISLSEVDMENG